MKFHLFTNGGLWYFNLKAANGEIVAQSEGVKNKQDALSTIDSIMLGAAVAEIEVEGESETIESCDN